MKRMISILIVIVTVLAAGVPGKADSTKASIANSASGERLFEYLQGENGKLLTLRSNYGYMTFIEDFKSDVLSLYLLEMTDMLIDTGAEPDKEKYMEVLVNIIATYDMDCADDITKQRSLDNLKELKDYAMDCVEMGKNAVSVMSGSSETTSELETALSTAVDGIGVLADNTDNWIDALSNLETIVQDYSDHDAFLKLVEDNSEGELKEASQTLQSGMKKALEIKLETYQDISKENFENYEEFFFSDIFFDAVKETPQYADDETLKYFVDTGDDLFSKLGTLGSAWDLGKMVGTLVGNVAVGGENLINRVLEMMALYDISLILQDETLSAGTEFLSSLGTEKEEALVNEYVTYSQYLIDCRIRGEYCLYSIVAKDSGLLSWFNKESAEEAWDWYEEKTEKILTIQNQLVEIITAETSEELSMYIGDFEQMYSVVGGNSASERGDHEEWMIGPDIQYGSYIGSSSVDEILLDSEGYSLFDIYVGQTVDEMKRNMLENGWNLQEISTAILKYKKETMNLRCDIQKGCVSHIGFWRDMMSEKLPDGASPDEDEKKMAIEIAKQKYGDEFSYFCTAKFIYQGKEFLVVDVKTYVDDHLTRVTQILIAKDGSYAGEGFYSANPENIEFYE